MPGAVHGDQVESAQEAKALQDPTAQEREEMSHRAVQLPEQTLSAQRRLARISPRRSER